MEIDRNFKIRLEGKKGGFVDIHEKTDNNKRLEHITASQVLADKGHQIQLMPEIDKHDTTNRTFFFPELRKENYKNPDARFNGILGDFKVPDGNPVTMKSIQNAISSTSRKEVSICVICLLQKEYSMHEVLSQIRSSLNNINTNIFIKEVWLILKENEILRIPRGVVSNKNFYKLVTIL